MKILCFGSLNIDYTYKVEHFVQKGETISSQSLQVFSGGKGLNQSIALAKAGAEVYHAGAVGTDGGFLLRQLEEAGVNTEHVAVLDEVRTGNAIIQNDKDGDNCIILYGGANQAITREQADQVLKSFDKGDYLLLQNEINELPYIMEKAHRKGMNVILNPSPMDEKMKELPLDDVDYFLLNEVEAGQILDTGETDGEILAERLLKRFPGASIVLTLGSKGSIYADREQKIHQKAYRVRAVDTTAAGDTFCGALAARLANGDEMRDAIEYALKAACLTVTRAGAPQSIPDEIEVLSSF